MSGAALRNLDQSHRRRSPRLKDIHVVYSEDRETYFCPLKHIKTEIIDPEEAAFPSTSEFNVACVADNDFEQDLHNVTLKDLRARCKAKNLKTEKIASEGHDIMNQTQSGNLENVKSDEEADLDEPLIALKQKRQKISPSKAKENMDVPTSPHPAKVEDTISKGDMASHIQTFSLDATLHDSATAKLGRRAMDLEHSEIEVIIDRRVEMVGDDICSAETEKRTCCKIEAEAHKEALVSSYCEKNSFEHSAVVLHQLPVEDDGCGQQPDFITQPTELNVSDHLCGLTHRVEAYLDDNAMQNKITNIVSSSECIDERSNHRKPLDISNSDVDTSSTGSELSLSSVNQSCEDYIDNDEYCYPEHVEANTPENVKAVEESCPIDEFNTETGSRSIVMQPDSCGSIERNCTSLEVGQMQADDQLGSVVCHSVITKGILLHMNVDQAATDNNCPFDKTIDLAHTANFFTQDGRLERIVFDALNNHVQRKSSETKRIVGVSDTTVILSPLIEANAALDSQLLFANGKEGSSKDMNQLKCAMNGDIRRSVKDQVSGEEIGFQHQLFQACVDMDKSAGVISQSSSAPKETQELPAGASDSTVTHQETNAQSKKSEFFIDEVSVEEHTPKKLLSKRKIMSPTSQEKLCNALTGIDLHGVERPNCDEIRQTLPQTTNMHGQPVLSTDRKIKDKTSLTCASKGVLKSTGSQSSQQMACTCMRSSSVLLDPRKAVEFSERQMHDIENIAANLIRSLKHMRSIVDESLSSELLALLTNSNSAQVEILPMITHAVLPAATLARPYSVSGDAILAVRRLLVCVLQLCGHVVYPSTRCLLFMCWVLGLLRYRLCDWIFSSLFFFRCKRKFVWDYRSGRKKVRRLTPPFSKEHISLLKGVAPGRSYYGCPKVFLSYDTISKTTDHVADADLLFPPEFLHSIKINNFPRHEISL